MVKIPNPRTIFSTPAIIALTGFFSSTAIVSLIFNKSGSGADFCAVNWSKSVARSVGMKVTSRGLENVDTSKTYVMVSNHQSHMDTIALYVTSPVPIRMLAKAELAKIPIFGRAMDRAGHIWITRDKSKKTDFKKLLNQVQRLKKFNRSLVVFAEGTRSLDGKIQPFKSGAFKIAKHFNLPIIPITIKGTHEILPAKTLRFSKGDVNVIFHKKIESNDSAVEELSERCHKIIADAL